MVQYWWRRKAEAHKGGAALKLRVVEVSHKVGVQEELGVDPKGAVQEQLGVDLREKILEESFKVEAPRDEAHRLRNSEEVFKMEIKNNQVAADPRVGNKMNPRRRAEIKTNLKVFKVDLKKGAP